MSTTRLGEERVRRRLGSAHRGHPSRMVGCSDAVRDESMYPYPRCVAWLLLSSSLKIAGRGMPHIAA